MAKKRVNSWTKRARQFFNRRFRSGDVVTGEDIRFKLMKRTNAKTYLSKPSDSNVWGGFVGGLHARGTLIDTGSTRAMKAPNSHGRRTPLYVVV